MELIHPNDKLSISINQENPLWCAVAAIKKSLPHQPSISRWAEPDRQGLTFIQGVIYTVRNI